jgi:hypothetical protein
MNLMRRGARSGISPSRFCYSFGRLQLLNA